MGPSLKYECPMQISTPLSAMFYVDARSDIHQSLSTVQLGHNNSAPAPRHYKSALCWVLRRDKPDHGDGKRPLLRILKD